MIRALGAVHDLLCGALALPLAFVIRTDKWPELTTSFLVMQFTLIGCVGIFSFMFGLNQGSWRYASIDDLLGIIETAVLAVLVAVLVTFAVSRLETIPRAVPVIACVCLVLLMCALRLSYRVLKERHLHRLFRAQDGGERVLVVGFSDEANAFLRYLGHQKKPAYQVMGLIDHSRRHVGRRLQNAKVLGSTDDLPDIVTRFQSDNMPISKIVVSPSKTDPAAMEAILVQATDLGLPVFTLPDASDLTQNDDGKPNRPTVIKLDDLLDRPVADIDLKPVAALLRDKVILVTGGGGSIGSGLIEQVLGYNPRRLVILDSSEHNLYAIEHRMREIFPYQDIKAILADVRESATIRSIMGQERPDIVFHAAALKHVPMVEHNPAEGAKTNVLGTLHVANAAVKTGVAVMVMISTDKAVNPTNVMGATKRFAEAYCQLLDRRPDYSTRFMTVRFGNVLGSSGSVVPLFSRQIEAGGPVTITHPEMKRYFMSMKEAVRLVLAACAKGVASPTGRGKIMVLHMGTQVKVVEIAHRMIRLAGLRPEVDIPIRFIGLRPGEKLYEERLAASEVVEPTADSWLQIATPRDVDGRNMSFAIAALEEAVAARDEARLLAAIRAVVPELVSDLPSTSNGPQHERSAQTIAFAEARSRLCT
jgi:FlaA1/EpsC-like NDP-sugar epimerase